MLKSRHNILQGGGVAMNNKELSAWADALVTLLNHGQTEEVKRILKSVIISDDSKDEKKKKEKQHT